MEEKLINQEEASPLEETAAVPQACAVEETVVVPQADTEEAPVLEEIPGEAEKSPMSAKKKLALLIGAAALLIAVIIAIPIYLNATVFDRVVSDMLKEYPFANNARGSDGSYMKIDTNPDDKDVDDMTTLELMLYSSTSEDSLDAIEYVNERLGFSGAVFDDMLNTTALMGRQRQSNRKYTVSWTYHPDRGLEVTYEKN